MPTKQTKAVKSVKQGKGVKAVKVVKKCAAIAVALCAVAFGGCVYKGAKVIEGTDLSIGLNVPSTDGTLQFQLLNYLSGFRLGVAENAKLTMHYSVAESNDYLAVVHTSSRKSIDATVEPCVDADYPTEQ